MKVPGIEIPAFEYKAGNEENMQRVRGISGSTLKIIAIFSMLVDHTAAVVLSQILIRNPDGLSFGEEISVAYISGMLQAGFTGRLYVAYLFMRNVIGRLAFPIYCFLLVEGFGKSRNRRRYAGRLFIFALISEIPFNLAFCQRVWDNTYQNVFFTLLLGLLMIWAMEKTEKLPAGFGLRLPCLAGAFLGAAFIAEMLRCDYGAKGIAAIALLYLFRKNRMEQIFAGCVAFVWEVTAPLAFIFVAFYNGRRGMKLKILFYVFYPLHLSLLYLLAELLFKT